VERFAQGLQKVLVFLIPCWCLVPVVIVTGLCFWALIEAPWVWKPLFIAGLLAITATATIWGARLGAQMRADRDSAARSGC